MVGFQQLDMGENVILENTNSVAKASDRLLRAGSPQWTAATSIALGALG